MPTVDERASPLSQADAAAISDGSIPLEDAAGNKVVAKVIIGQQSLMTETLRLLHERRQPLPTIQAETGIPFYWLRKFLGKEIKDPSVNRVQVLYEYLSKRKLIP